VTTPRSVSRNLAEKAYDRLKNDISDFKYLPGERFSEAEVAGKMGVSRTPIREALFRLAREGYVQVLPRSGWMIRPFDFDEVENLYDLRILLEESVVQRLCDMDPPPDLRALKDTWLVPESERLRDGHAVADLDEAFHRGLVAAAGNPELVKVHDNVTERIRIIRRLDFTKPERIKQTYDEHARILRAVVRRSAANLPLLVRSHIEVSKAEVRHTTLHMLYTARQHVEDRAAAKPPSAAAAARR
jgi:DNA-binding GntR family transcriptional regulator